MNIIISGNIQIKNSPTVSVKTAKLIQETISKGLYPVFVGYKDKLIYYFLDEERARKFAYPFTLKVAGIEMPAYIDMDAV